MPILKWLTRDEDIQKAGKAKYRLLNKIKNKIGDARAKARKYNFDQYMFERQGRVMLNFDFCVEFK